MKKPYLCQYGKELELIMCVCVCVILVGNRAMFVFVVEKKNKYPGVCSHGYYHDVGGAALLSPSSASLLHSLKVARRT